MFRFLFHLIVEIFFETVCFFIGELVIYAVSFGRWKTSLQKGSQTPARQVVTSLIGMATIALGVWLVVWAVWLRGSGDAQSEEKTSFRPGYSARKTACLSSYRRRFSSIGSAPSPYDTAREHASATS